MATCPKCGNRIPFRRLWKVSRFSPSVVCPTCNSTLEYKISEKGRIVSTILGAVAGGLGVLFGFLFGWTGNIMYLLFAVATIVAAFFVGYEEAVRFSEFELRKASS